MISCFPLRDPDAATVAGTGRSCVLARAVPLRDQPKCPMNRAPSAGAAILYLDAFDQRLAVADH
ncbi:MAG: hypothetical protein HPM95_05250 [Alphaproteobacteria bacterium]|nr:hypothetical protein [Alphaproteobacteria bacterium]